MPNLRHRVIERASGGDLYQLPADRMAIWRPGVTYNGGIPDDRTQYGSTINPLGGGQSDIAQVQAAIDNCPSGQYVKLAAGTFVWTSDGIDKYLIIDKSDVTIRGTLDGNGRPVTILDKQDGEVPYGDPPNDPFLQYPLVIVGNARYPKLVENTAVALTTDATKGSYSVTVADATGYSAGQFVQLDEEEFACGSWKSMPDYNGAPQAKKIWSTDRYCWGDRTETTDPDGTHGAYKPGGWWDPGDWYNANGFLTWFARGSRTAGSEWTRPVCETKEIESINGNTITFTTPIHMTYTTSHSAQLCRWDTDVVSGVGIEDLAGYGGSDNGIQFLRAVRCWAKNVELLVCSGSTVDLQGSFQCELRDSYIHDTAWPFPGGGGYAISHSWGASESLIENNIIKKFNKVMVSRCAGTGCVYGYNYCDDGYIGNYLTWQECGLGASHMIGPHHVLFEGNLCFNYDSDATFGASIYMTVFRNWLTAHRDSYSDIDNIRCVGLGYSSRWHSFVGNVLGRDGQVDDWVYDMIYPWPGSYPTPLGWAIWKLGYEMTFSQEEDPEVRNETIRDGNFDYLTNEVRWHGEGGNPGDGTPATLPDSLYLSSKPAFFGSNTWPWVDPTGSTKLYTLPAKARYDAM